MTVDPGLTTTLLALAAAMVLRLRPELVPTRPRRESVVVYPVRGQAEADLRADLGRIGPRDLLGRPRRVLAVIDHDDAEALVSLRRLRSDLPHVEIVVAPDAADPSWCAAWTAWLADSRPVRGRLSPKQRRQVVYGHFHTRFH